MIRKLREARTAILADIRETIDAPTLIDPKANAKNLMALVQRIERSLT